MFDKIKPSKRSKLETNLLEEKKNKIKVSKHA